MIWSAGAPFEREMLLIPLPCCFIHIIYKHQIQTIAWQCRHCTREYSKRLALKSFLPVKSTKENTQKLDVLSVYTHETCGVPCYNTHKAYFVLKYEDTVFPRFFSAFFPFWRLFWCILQGMCQDNTREGENTAFNMEVDFILLCNTKGTASFCWTLVSIMQKEKGGEGKLKKKKMHEGAIFLI